MINRLTWLGLSHPEVPAMHQVEGHAPRPVETPAPSHVEEVCAGANDRRLPGISSVIVASVWLVHGLYNKLLGGSPRQLAIVQSIPGFDGAIGERMLVITGLAEVALAFWVLSGSWPYLCATAQTIALLSMNTLELAYARDLLLWPAGLLPANIAFLVLAWIAANSNTNIAFRTRLQRHPLAIEAHLEDCLTITYALPAHVLRRLVPRGLQLETVGDYGFVAVALVQARSLRPAGLPAALGQDFFLAGYRIFTTFRCPNGRRLRGLRIVRSDTNRKRMVVGGNLLTHYQYHHCAALIDATAEKIDVTIRTRDGAGDLNVRADRSERALPAGSPFSSVREARRFAGPLPFTFDYESETDSIIAIKARRTNWEPVPVSVDVQRIAFFDQPVFAGCSPRLAAAFHVKAVDYCWERGVRYLGVRS